MFYIFKPGLDFQNNAPAGVGGNVMISENSHGAVYFCQVRFLCRFAFRRLRRLCFDIFRRLFFFRFPIEIKESGFAVSHWHCKAFSRDVIGLEFPRSSHPGCIDSELDRLPGEELRQTCAISR